MLGIKSGKQSNSIKSFKTQYSNTPLFQYPMIPAAVFLLSLSSLAFEVLLARVFSISQWNHLSFMVISITLFGFAAGGTFLNIIDTRINGWEKKLSSTGPLEIFTVLYTVSAITAFIVLNRIPLDYFRLPLEPVQALYLLTVYLFLSLPFFFTGTVVSLTFASFPEKTGSIYFASMIGSACGAVIPALFLPFVHEGNLIVFTTLIPLSAVIFRPSNPVEKHLSSKNIVYFNPLTLRLCSVGIVLAAAVLVMIQGHTLVRVNPSPYKALSQTLQFPRTRVVETVTGIRGRFDSVKSPYIRFAPGLSLKFTDRLPDQTATYRDGDSPVFFYDPLPLSGENPCRFTLFYSGYLLNPAAENILLIQRGGGSSIPCAKASGINNITIVEPHPQIASMFRRHYYIPVVNENPRAFLVRSNQRFDIIHIENWGTSLPGVAALTQDYLFTTGSLSEYFTHLTEKGVLIISRKLLLPPSDTIRLWAGVYESLRSLGAENPEQHMAVLRNWSHFTLIVSKRPIEDATGLLDFAQRMNFDMVYLPGISRNMVNRFNVFDTPHHFLEINRLADAYRSGTEKLYFETYPLDVSPQTDNRPFPYRFLKWTRLKALYKMTGSRFYSLFMSGELVVPVVFLEAFGISALLLMLSFYTIPRNTRKVYFPHILYFLSVGAGFMFVELFFIKEYIFVFDDPVVSLTVVLAGILVFSGLGGYWSQRVRPKNFSHALAALISVLIFMCFALNPILDRIQGLSILYRYLLCLILLIPPGFLMGLPFPLGMQYLLNLPSQRAYAWTANGCASVLASVASAQIALSFGISEILIGAISAYFLALIVGRFKIIREK